MSEETTYCALCDSEALNLTEKGTPLCATCSEAYSWGMSSPNGSLRFLGEEDEEEEVVFKVWVVVERVSSTEEPVEMGLPDCIGEFDSFEEAAEHVRTLPGWRRFGSLGSDYHA